MSAARDRALVRAYDRSRVSLALLAGTPSADPPPRWMPPLVAGIALAVALSLVTTFWPHAASPQTRPLAPPSHAAKAHHHVHRKKGRT